MALHQAPPLDTGGAEHLRRTVPVRLLPDQPGDRADGDRRFRTLIEQAADGIFVSDATGRIVLANSRMCLLLGYPADEMVGLDILETYLPEDREIGRQFLAQLPVGTTFRFERMLMRKDGGAIPIEASVAWLPGGERQTIVRDMTARRRTEEMQRLEERRLRAIVRLSELEAGSLPALLDAAVVEIRALVASAVAFIGLCDSDESHLTVRAWAQEGGEPRTVRGERLAVETSGWLGESLRQRKTIAANDLHGRAVGVSIAGSEIAGPRERFLSIPIRSRGRLVGVVGVADKPGDYTDNDARQLTQMLDVVWKIAERQQAEDDLRQLNEELEHRVAERTAEYEQANGGLERANGQLEAANQQLQALLTEQESLQAELAYRALHDPLTGLANRHLFAERLEYAFEHSKRGVAVLWIDLDHFKEINDIFGHDVGDEVLVAIADRLRDVVRSSDDIARMGGDEFAIVLPNVYEADARVVADRVVEALTDPESFRLRVGASVGLAWQAPGGHDGQALVRQADVAMYRAKAAGGSRVVAG